MYLKKIISIKNYRNISNLEFQFDEEINFIVGENNVGKTNLVELLNGIFNTGKFYEEDFYDVKDPIKIIFQISYSEDELGFFENTFDIDEEYAITITAVQESIDSRVEYCHTESGAYINHRTIKMLNFIYYSSLRSPVKELSFINNIGTGKVLNYIMKRSLETKNLEQMDLLNKDDIDEVIVEVNSKFEKLHGLSREKIEAYLSDDKESIINRLLEVGDSTGRNISKLGDGIQYSFNIFLNILELLVHLKTTKKTEDYENLLIKNEEGRKYLPLIIGLDEPEIHQHPYRQRALIKSIRKIIDNENENFLEIVKELFDIDGFIGQVFVVTHSPNILLDDYKQIVRVYKQETNVGATSGNALNFEKDIHKHLRRSFMYFKEAMFAKSVILVEGDTEFGAVPVFAKKLGYDLDDESVGIIKLDGADGVLKYLELFKSFKINVIAILDKDKEDTYTGNSDINFTTGEDFEEEIFDEFSFDQYLKYLESIEKHKFLIPYLKSKIEEFNIHEFIKMPTKCKISKEIGEIIMSEIRINEISELRNVKNAINGALLAEFADAVPKAFKDVIKEALGESSYE